jgi:Na+-transporting methylmalonyl-CoA/oxaloacetate decarboxylase beta subunit
MSADQKSRPESDSEYYEAYKHLTTLSTGSILILLALLEKLFVNPKWRALVIVALISFIVSILSSVLMMFLIGNLVRESRIANNKAETMSILFSLSSFLLGIISFVIFSMVNFLR